MCSVIFSLVCVVLSSHVFRVVFTTENMILSGWHYSCDKSVDKSFYP